MYEFNIIYLLSYLWITLRYYYNYLKKDDQGIFGRNLYLLIILFLLNLLVLNIMTFIETQEGVYLKLIYSLKIGIIVFINMYILGINSDLNYYMCPCDYPIQVGKKCYTLDYDQNIKIIHDPLDEYIFGIIILSMLYAGFNIIYKLLN